MPPTPSRPGRPSGSSPPDRPGSLQRESAADLTPTEIRSALRDCYDPNLPCNIVDLGLIDRIDVTPDPEAPGAGVPGVPRRFIVEILLTPITPDDAVETHLRALISNRLAGLERVSRSTVSVQHQPAWTPTRILPAGRRTLGLEGNPTLVQIR